MKKWIALFLLFTACKSITPEKFNTRVPDSLFNFYEQHELYFVSAEISRGAPIFKRSVGYENVEENKPLDSNSVFLIGSITKTYTATMILQLIEEGALSLTDKLSRFFPDIPEADAIDMEMLLRHRSGLFNYTNRESFFAEVTQPVSKEELLDRFASLEIVFPPGERAEYSNTNYVLLGFIVEELTNDTYENQLQARILNKLGLRNTHYGRPDDLSNFAYSYVYMDDQWVKAEPVWNTDWARGAGAISATTSDVAAFFKGLFAGKLFSREMLDKMMTLQDGFGLGLVQANYRNKTLYGHDGGIENYRSSCVYNPEDSLMLTRISNAAFDGNPLDVSIQLLNAIYGNPLTFPDTTLKQKMTVPPDTLIQYEGTYSAPDFPLKIGIFVRDGQLYGQATGQPEFPLTAHTYQKFSFSPASITLEFFIRDGKPKFHFEQGPVKRVFSREE